MTRRRSQIDRHRAWLRVRIREALSKVTEDEIRLRYVEFIATIVFQADFDAAERDALMAQLRNDARAA